MVSIDANVNTVNNNEKVFSELGAYFTDRHITNYIYTNIKSSINADETIKNITDEFGGSGGFTTGYTIQNDTKK